MRTLLHRLGHPCVKALLRSSGHGTPDVSGLLHLLPSVHSHPEDLEEACRVLLCLHRSVLGPNIARLSFGATASASPYKRLCRKHLFSAKIEVAKEDKAMGYAETGVLSQ